MIHKMSLVILITLITSTFFTGCTEMQPGPTVSPTSVPSTTVPTKTINTFLIPGPTQTMPPNYVVVVNVQRDPIDPTITVTFRGGKGQYYVRDVDVRLTRSDGVVVTKKLGHDMMDEVTFDGTKGKDRVEVTVTLITNDQYKIIDALYDYYSHA